MYDSSDQRGQQKLALSLELSPNTPSLPMGKFSLIVADPPWQYSLRETDPTHRGRCPYPQMSVEDMTLMPVRDIVAKQAYLLLWTTKDHLREAFLVMQDWGFRYKSLLPGSSQRMSGPRFASALVTMVATAPSSSWWGLRVKPPVLRHWV